MTSPDGSGRPPRGRAAWLPWAAATAAIAVAAAMLTGGFVATRYEARLGVMARQMAAERDRLRDSEQALREQVAVQRGAFELLRDPATRVVALHGTAPAPEATGRVIWNARTGGHVFVANLPPTLPGQAYQLWTVGEGAPRSAGMLRIDASGRAALRIEPADARRVAGFRVTLEPEGGAPAPTGDTVLASR